MKGNRTALIGLVLGVVGAVLLGLFVAQSTGDSVSNEDTVAALVTRTSITADTSASTLGSAQVEVRQVPVSLAPEQRLEGLEDVAGQRTVRALGAGEILTRSQFAGLGPADGGLVVPAGYEAVSVEAALAPGVEGFVTVGSNVNVYANVPSVEGGFTQLVLGHLNVLAVTRGNLTGAATQPTAETVPNQVVLLLQVRQQDAPLLIFAEGQSNLYFSLVNPDDSAPPSVRVDGNFLDPGIRTAEIQAATERLRAEEAAAAAAQAAAAATPAVGATAAPDTSS